MYSNKTNLAKSYKSQEVMENHSLTHIEWTQHNNDGNDNYSFKTKSCNMKFPNTQYTMLNRVLNS